LTILKGYPGPIGKFLGYLEPIGKFTGYLEPIGKYGSAFDVSTI